MDENALKDTTNFSYISVYFMRSLLTLFFGFLLMSLWGQKRALFNDTLWPKSWRGDTAHFIPLANGINLKAPSSGVTRIFHTEPVTSPATISINMFLNFPPSANNQVKFYFLDKPELTNETKGYVLQIGENGPDDRWELYALLGTEQNKLFRGPPVSGATSAIAQQMTLRLDSISWWRTAPTNDSIYELTNLPRHLFSSLPAEIYLGLECVYTETRKDKFLFEDLSVVPSDIDTLPPRVESVVPISDRKVLLKVNEPLGSSYQETENYWLIPEMTTPLTAELRGANYIELTFEVPFPSNQALFLEVSNLRDYYNNILPNSRHLFIYEQYDEPAYGDILIHEIMADPSPSQGLPEVEYLELFNPTEKTFNLEGYTLRNGRRIIPFTKKLLEPRSFLLIGPKPGILALNHEGEVYGLENWEAISNTSGTLSLKNKSQKLIHQVDYNQEWYADQQKSSGGYSLEMVDVNDRCAGSINWRGSIATKGGTPGRSNSWPVQKLIPLDIEDFSFPNPNILLIQWNRVLDPSVFSLDQLVISPPLSIANLEVLEGIPVWAIVFEQELKEAETYRLSILPPHTDCSGTLWSDTLIFYVGKPKQARPGDLVFNELLFNPRSGHSDYVELFNRTESYLDLKGVFFKNNLAERGIEVKVDKIAPHGYLCFSAEGKTLAASYPVNNPKNLVLQDIPSLPDDEGIIYLVDDLSGLLLDYQYYHHSWHNKLIDNVEGVALERLSASDTTHEVKNWTSASAVVKFGTPGTKNSQAQSDYTDLDKFLQMSNNVFSPNGDGYEDYLELTMNPNESGYTVQVWIYNEYGTLIHTLIPQTTLGLNYNHFVWDGTNVSGQAVSMGRYIIFARFIHPSGQVQQIKKSIIVAGLNK